MKDGIYYFVKVDFMRYSLLKEQEACAF